ncbi:hypothetical protein HHK36_003127 [Tetracentron sinense]|uniref:TF-B3 domain-containing protein n=1 Tax=Tetracentron sinense TaxID=13715 RepID=A0A834ZRY2_TETSI|nr:hypothetical protein HHK36_003127 [Tetracentron sinense]
MVKARMKISSSDKSPEFFKVYLPKLSSQQLHIPPAFIRHFNGVVPNKTILKDPIGRFWHVEVKKVENDLFFQNGWVGFVESHSIELGDFLVFRYKGNSVFDVRIFGKTGCKKEKALVNGNIDMIASRVKKEEPETRETFSKPTLGCKRKYPKRDSKRIGKSNCLPDVDGYTRSRRTVAVKVEEGRVFEAADFGEPKNVNFTPSIQPSRPHVLLKRLRHGDALSHFLLNEVAKSISKHFRSNRSKQKQNVPATIAVTSVGTATVAIMDTADHVPKEVVTNDRRMKPAVIFRDPNGKSWPVSVCFREDGRFDITEGWQNFWRRNGLGRQDKCIFEFIRGKYGEGNGIQVHIYRARKVALKPHSYMTRR